MKLSTKLEKVLNDQINLEFCSAYAYLGMAAYFERTAFTGFGKWMEVQSKEELGHANRFFKYIVERGGKVRLEAIPAPKCDYKSPLLVEVVRTIATDSAAFEAAYEFGKSLGKVPVRTSDKTGFIVNRLLVPYMLDAIRAYEEGVGSIPDIDNAMKLGCGYPMGPFTLLDFVGLDTTYYITQVMFDEFRERRFASPPLLKRLVMAGWYGRKTGKGFYDYADPSNPVPGQF